MMENVQEQPKKKRGRPKKQPIVTDGIALRKTVLSRLEDAFLEHMEHSFPPVFDKVWFRPSDYKSLHHSLPMISEVPLKIMTIMGHKLEVEVMLEPDAFSFIGKKEYYEYIASGTKRSAVSSMPEHMKQIYF